MNKQTLNILLVALVVTFFNVDANAQKKKKSKKGKTEESSKPAHADQRNLQLGAEEGPGEGSSPA